MENDVTKENLLFGDYDRFVRFMYNNYVTPTNVEESLQMYLSNGPLILDKDKEMASHVSDLITNGNGTYGLDPISISNGLNHYLTDKTIDEIEYTYDYSDDYYDYKKVAKQIMRTLREDFPVILHIVGMTKLYSFESTYINTTYFHNLNILKIEQDTILDKTFVYCSSGSQKRKIDLKECWNSIAYSDEVLGVGGHINVDSLIYTFKNSKHSIVYPVRTTYRGS